MVGGTNVQQNAGGTQQVHVSPGSDEPFSTRVIETVATATGIDDTPAGFALYDAIDVDAIDALYRHTQRTDASWELAFDADGHDIVVSSDGTVTIG